MKYAKPPLNKIIFPLVIGFQICILAWMNAYWTWAENYKPDGHEEERKRIIESVEKELRNKKEVWLWTWKTERAITNDFKTNQGKKWNAETVSQKWKNLAIPVMKYTTGASVDMPKSGIIQKPVSKECNKECKIKVLIKSGIRKEISETLVNECKNTAIDARNCIIVGWFIFANESSWWANCYANNCSWMKAWWIAYKSIEDWVKDWVRRYNLYWFRQSKPSSFYSSQSWVLPKTRYCLSEIQPDWTHLDYCKNGAKHAWAMYNLLTKQF